MTHRQPPAAPGFADPTRDAQRAFRAVLDALAHPTRPFPLAGPADPPAALGPGLAAVALTLLDEDCAVWLGGALASDAEVAAWLAFHTGARRANAAAEADFVIADPAALPPLASLALGTDEAPAPVRHGRARRPRRRCANHGPARFPRGDRESTAPPRSTPRGPLTASAERGTATRGSSRAALTCCSWTHDTVAALPRTTRLTAADQELED